jgi:hypothetical protein
MDGEIPHWLSYPLDENDYKNVKALYQRFGIEIPAEYEEFVKQDKSIKR